MKKILMGLGVVMAVVLLLGAIGFLGALAYVNHQESRALWLNYSVNDAGMVLLVRPDLPEKQILIDPLELPPACLKNFDHKDWMPGVYGRVSFNRNWCWVDRYTTFSKEAAAQHHRRISQAPRPHPQKI